MDNIDKVLKDLKWYIDTWKRLDIKGRHGSFEDEDIRKMIHCEDEIERLGDSIGLKLSGIDDIREIEKLVSNFSADELPEEMEETSMDNLKLGLLETVDELEDEELEDFDLDSELDLDGLDLDDEDLEADEDYTTYDYLVDFEANESFAALLEEDEEFKELYDTALLRAQSDLEDLEDDDELEDEDFLDLEDFDLIEVED